MIPVNTLGNDFPSFPEFQRMLRAYEREKVEEARVAQQHQAIQALQAQALQAASAANAQNYIRSLGAGLLGQQQARNGVFQGLLGQRPSGWGPSPEEVMRRKR